MEKNRKTKCSSCQCSLEKCSYALGSVRSLWIFYIGIYVPYEHLHTNFSVRTFGYVLFSNELYPLRTFAYEQLRTNFMHTNYFHTYFGPRIVRETCRPGQSVSTIPSLVIQYRFSLPSSRDELIIIFVLFYHQNMIAMSSTSGEEEGG